MFEHFKKFGVLRILLLIAALILMFIRPEPGSPAARSGVEMIPTLIAPALTPLVFMLLLFDLMMSRIRMTENHVREKFRHISYIEFAVALLLFLIWLPFFLAIGR